MDPKQHQLYELHKFLVLQKMSNFFQLQIFGDFYWWVVTFYLGWVWIARCVFAFFLLFFFFARVCESVATVHVLFNEQ